METNNKRIYLYVLLFLFSIIILSAYQEIQAQVNPDQLAEKVRQKIASYYIEEYNISADTAGVINIEGKSSTLYDKLKIADLISEVRGVTAINNKIEVDTPPTPDAEIKSNIEDELQFNNIILEPENINVEVSNGVVHLSGTVSYFREKLMAQSIASWQDGVVGMTDDLIVLSPAAAKSDDNLKEIIGDLLRKEFNLENNVKFDVNDGIVHLYGTAKSLWAKYHIQESIQHILGIKDVINDINVESGLN